MGYFKREAGRMQARAGLAREAHVALGLALPRPLQAAVVHLHGPYVELLPSVIRPVVQ